MPPLVGVEDGAVSPPSATHSTMSLTRGLQLPQPVPARVAAWTDSRVRQPPSTHLRISRLVTPMQLQTLTASGISSSLFLGESAIGGALSNNSSRRSSESGEAWSNAWISAEAFLRVAEHDRADQACRPE